VVVAHSVSAVVADFGFAVVVAHSVSAVAVAGQEESFCL